MIKKMDIKKEFLIFYFMNQSKEIIIFYLTILIIMIVTIIILSRIFKIFQYKILDKIS